MSIAKKKPLSVERQTNQEQLPKIEAPVVRSTLVDEKYVPRNSLIAYVDGSNYTVNYYSQILAAHSELRGLDAEQNTVLQQYTKIMHVELKVTTPLTGTPDDEFSTTLVTGSSIVTPPLIPNIGDMFIASIGDGYEGLFEVKDSTRKSMNHDSVYAIDYVLIGRVSSLQNRITDLESKVSVTYYFYKDNLILNRNPYIVESKFNSLINLKSARGDIIKYYFKTFFSKEFMTLIVPGQETTIYDKYVTEFMNKIVDKFDAPEILKMRILNTDSDVYLEQGTIWSLLLDCDLEGIPLINQKMGLISTSLFSGVPIFESIRFTGIKDIVYPINPNIPPEHFLVFSNEQLNGFYETNTETLSYKQLVDVPSIAGDIQQLLIGNEINLNNNNLTVLPIKKVTDDDFYVFSESFYYNQAGQSMLEVMTHEYLKQRELDPILLNEIYKRYRYWGYLEQFYYLPIILFFINKVLSKY